MPHKQSRNKPLRRRARAATVGIAAGVAAAAAAAGLAFVAPELTALIRGSVPARRTPTHRAKGDRGIGRRGLEEGKRVQREGSSLPFDTLIVVDAGSSGCRLNVYSVQGEGESMRVLGRAGGKIEPGLSSFANSPEAAATYILPLLVNASKLVPSEKHASTKLFIRSTAGMRLLPEDSQEAIYDEIYQAVVSDTSLPFAVDREGLGTISGDMEAFYAVLSANYLEGRIDARLHPTGHEAGELGALDMGGASTQIIFRHETRDGHLPPEALCLGDADHHACEFADGLGDERVSVQAVEGRGSAETVPVSHSDFWGVSHLGYGVTEIRMRVWDYLVEKHASAGGGREEIIINPCTFVDYVESWKGYSLRGSGDHLSCEETIAKILWEEEQDVHGAAGDENARCGAEAEKACGVGGVNMPAVRGEFLAMSVFYYAMHCLHELGPSPLTGWPSPSLAELRHAAEGFCSLNWGTLAGDEDGTDANEHEFTSSIEGLAHRCVEVVYLTTLLRDGYGFPEHGRNVTYALESDGMELEWTLGYALSELVQTLDALEESNAEDAGGTASVAKDIVHLLDGTPPIKSVSGASREDDSVGREDDIGVGVRGERKDRNNGSLHSSSSRRSGGGDDRGEWLPTESSSIAADAKTGGVGSSSSLAVTTTSWDRLFDRWAAWWRDSADSDADARAHASCCEGRRVRNEQRSKC